MAKDKLKELGKEINRLEDELDKLSAQCQAYQNAFVMADAMAEIARHAYWGSERAKEKIQSIIDEHGKGEGIWANWDKVKKDLQSGRAMREILAKRIA